MESGGDFPLPEGCLRVLCNHKESAGKDFPLLEDRLRVLCQHKELLGGIFLCWRVVYWKNNTIMEAIFLI